jgi:hypothetical protein
MHTSLKYRIERKQSSKIQIIIIKKQQQKQQSGYPSTFLPSFVRDVEGRYKTNKKSIRQMSIVCDDFMKRRFNKRVDIM